MGLFRKIFGGLKKTADAIGSGISAIFVRDFDDEFYDELCDLLILADIGVEAGEKIIDDIKSVAKKEKIKTEDELKRRLAASIAEILGETSANTFNPTRASVPTKINASVPTHTDESLANSAPGSNTATAAAPVIYMVVGVNGVGKTTSIGKLGQYYKNNGKSVLFVSADTFRAAATEQLDEWATRVGVRIVKQGEGADPAGVVFDGLTSAKAKGDDITIIDTAGRLHNKANLMEELKKIDRVIARVTPDVAYKKLLVIDATTGGNALSQVEYFNDAVGIDGIILTKLDGTAKGGIVVAIKQKYNIPVVFVGVGEKPDDLIPFNAIEFANGLMGIA
ncbi:MAG: signal recognition particle-docking protein FtsY [Christensenellaceae bacterium]|jgi:fused signal recognition particle receptor|nr:signal recognition particle-docking protein FtsY [Christensenellaceae bacterium]